MAEKCLGVREDTGDRCNRPASSGSDFCFMHKPQGGDARIAYLEHDVYHCPDDGQQLLFVPDLCHYRCDMCGGVLMSAKDIDSEVLGGILELPEVVEEGLSVECPTCSSDGDQSDGETALTNIAVEWYFWIHTGQYTADTYQCGVSNVGHCKVCGSTWFPGPGEFDALGRALGKRRIIVWRKQFRRMRKVGKIVIGLGRGMKNPFGEHEQTRLRQVRLEEVAREWNRETARRTDNLCIHIAENGKTCDYRKSTKSTHDQDYCYKHQPKAKTKPKRKSKGDKKAKRTYNRYRKGGRKGQR